MPVPVYSLKLDRPDLNYLRREPDTDRWFPAELTAGDRRLPVYIGYRGRFSREQPKRSFDFAVQGHERIEGHRRLHLNAAYRDPSLLRGRLAFAVFAEIGLPVPKAWHVWLTMNGEPMGLYTAMEAMDGDWLLRQGETDGAIYYGVGGDGNFGLLDLDSGKAKKHVTDGFEKCFPDDSDYSDLEELIYAITLPNSEAFASHIDEVIDVEECLRWLIGVIFVSHTDGLTHNFALLRRADRRWQLSPWDCDGTFGRTPWGTPLPHSDPALVQVDGNYLAARLLASPRWSRRYRELWADLLDGPLASIRVHQHLASIYAEIKSAARVDDQKWRSSRHFEREPAYIRQWLANRTAFLRRELEGFRAGSVRPFGAH